MNQKVLFIGNSFTYNNAKTNFDKILSSNKDMTGIQKLVDKYLRGY